MKIEHPTPQPPTLEELKDLEKLKAIIERATADGFLTHYEMDTIKLVMRADGQITPQEIELCQQLIWDKISRGELQYDWEQFF
ncbi:hypothetical protein [Gloeothece verrucosa]|uniref:Uncharacterized protein n=1 Tax=Gloeothece verrucosa (strain PCC 7822) TaxID=497965 RepID=E0U7F4_GLOV7|nr:hypothetical protein [Gloeothece verrucosa]ADN13650.1 conserved hypothetical protein [Gloeothece verrucosa PCC 7822]